MYKNICWRMILFASLTLDPPFLLPFPVFIKSAMQRIFNVIQSNLITLFHRYTHTHNIWFVSVRHKGHFFFSLWDKQNTFFVNLMRCKPVFFHWYMNIDKAFLLNFSSSKFKWHLDKWYWFRIQMRFSYNENEHLKLLN